MAEIETIPVVTDAMIEAGWRALGGFREIDGTAAYACFKAMVCAEPRYVRSLLATGLLEHQD